MTKGKSRRYRPIEKLFLLDVLADKNTRPRLLYAAGSVVVGAALYHWLEGWTWLDSTYFVVITITTIGYGDFTPTRPITRLLTIFFALNGIVILLALFDAIRSVRAWNVRNVDEEIDEVSDKNAKVDKDEVELKT